MKTCHDCTKPKGALPPRVIEIANEVQPALFFRVNIAPELGDDTTLPPSNLDYRNTLLYYESVKHAYLFDSAGIPTQISVDPIDIDWVETELRRLGVEFEELHERVEDLDDFAHTEVSNLREITGNLQRNLEQETADRQTTDNGLQEQIDAIEARSDVVDVVDTYADLENYDTSSMTANDVIKVLQDETHEGAISYYRYTEQGEAMKGEEMKMATSTPDPMWGGDEAYTWDEDTGELTFGGFDGGVSRAVSPVFSLPEGFTENFYAEITLNDYLGFNMGSDNLTNTPCPVIANQWAQAGTTFLNLKVINNFFRPGFYSMSTSLSGQRSVTIKFYKVVYSHWNYIGSVGPYYTKAETDEKIAELESPKIKNLPKEVLGGSDSAKLLQWNVGADSIQPKVRTTDLETGNTFLRSQSNSIPAATPAQAGVMSAADKANLDALVEGGGGSSVELLSEYSASPATSQAYDASYVNKRLNGWYVTIGVNAEVTNSGMAIGEYARANNPYDPVAVGRSTSSTGRSSVAVGSNANVSSSYGVALGARSTSSSRGSEVSVGDGSDNADYGTRYLTNVRDGELPQDAVTVHQLNDAVGNINTLLETLISGEGAK